MTRRIERVNHLIRQEISDVLQREVKDPRLGGFVVITDVRTSPDMKYARISVSQIGGEVDTRDILRALAAAAGFLRKELAKRLTLRSVPELTFEWDDSIEKEVHIQELIDRVSQQR